MGQKFKVNQQQPQQSNPEATSQQQKINKLVMKRSTEKSKRKLYLTVIVAGILGAALLYLIFINSQNKSRLILEDVHADYLASEDPSMGKQYHLKEHMKREAHPDFQKYSKRTEAGLDPDWVGNEKAARYIAKKFLEYSNTTLDNDNHYEGMEIKWQPYYNIMNNDNYCLQSDTYHMTHPDSINKNYFIFSDFDSTKISREVVSDYGIDTMPDVELLDLEKTYLIGTKRIPTETAMIHSQQSRLHHYFEINKQLFCNYQIANHIPGKWSITGKDNVINNYRIYQKQSFVDSQACKRTMTFMPQTFRLYDEKECKDFFTHIQSQQYEDLEKKEGIVYILKKGSDVHRGEGIVLISPNEKQNLLKRYENGKQCGVLFEVELIQKYIANPIKVNGFKIELRMYFLIASTNPLIIYVQKLPFIKKCGLPYDPFNFERAAHICNVSVSVKDTTSKEVNLDMFFEELTQYLLENKVISNPKWIEQTILPQVYRAVIHLVRSGYHNLLRDSRFYEAFAVDFLIDESQRVWFLENNPNPQVMRNTVRRSKRNQIMFGDIFQIQFAYLRSRAFRLNKFAKFLLPLYQKYKTLDISDFKRGFIGANENALEPEFESQIRKDSSFVKVYDENQLAEKKFAGFLPRGCLFQKQLKEEEEENEQRKKELEK